jgi:hypothetical protein
MADGSRGQLVEVSGRENRRGSYVVGPKLRVAIEAMASGRARTIQAASELAGLSREGLSKALARPNVKDYLQRLIREELGVGATRASRKVMEIMENSENSIAQLSAAKLAMGDLCRLVWSAVVGLFQSRAALQAEILVLRHQLNALRRKAPSGWRSAPLIGWYLAGLYRLAPGVVNKNPQAGYRDPLGGGSHNRAAAGQRQPLTSAPAASGSVLLMPLKAMAPSERYLHKNWDDRS